MLVGLAERGIKPMLVIVADVGNERAGTYAARPAFDAWMEKVWGMKSVDVRYQPKNYKHWPHYYTLLENCLTNSTLPSLAYGFHSCSSKWKITPMNKFIETLPWAQAMWAKGQKIAKAIGFDNTPHEQRRACKGSATFAVQTDEKDRYELTFPLQQWGWTREDCVKALERAGLPVPPKSSCFMCPAMKPFEVDTLEINELKTIVVIEARAAQRHLDYAEKKGWPNGVGKPIVGGLWRSAVKGLRGATPHPASMTEYIRQKGLLPSVEIDRLIAATPTQVLTAADFEKLGFNNWTDWLESILNPEDDAADLAVIESRMGDVMVPLEEVLDKVA